MKEKIADIDILEELKKNLDEILKEPTGKDEMSNGNLYEYERGYELDLEEIKAISNLIAENKELKEITETLRKENVELIIQRRQYELHYIPKSKVQGLIDEINKAYEDSKNEYGESEYYYPDYTIDILQSLLGKE